MGSVGVGLATWASFVGGVGCDSCNRDHPYTPIAVDTAPTPSSPQAMPSAAPPASGGPEAATELPQLVDARRIEPPVGRIDVGGRPVELPASMVAEWSLEQAAAGSSDGKLDAVVWLRPEAPPKDYAGPLGELWYFPVAADAKRLWKLPDFVPSGDGCRLDTKLQGVGRSNAWFYAKAVCTSSLPQRTPTQALVYLAQASARPVIFGLRVAEPALGESLEVTPSSRDRDGDGIDDLTLSFDFAVADTAKKARVELGWLSRAAGVAADESALAGSLRAPLAELELRAAKKANFADIQLELQALRRLLATLCQQAATPRVWNAEGDPLRCPGLSDIHLRLSRIEIQSAVVQNDVPAALHAYAVANRELGGIPDAERESLRKRIAKLLAQVNTALPVATTVRPKSLRTAIHYSPLRFDSDGTLLVITDKSTVERVAMDGTNGQANDDPDAGAVVTAWPLEVSARNGRRWTGVVPACDRSELLLSFTETNGALAPLFATKLLAPRPGVCRSPRAWPVQVAPIAWLDEQPSAVVDGACLDSRGPSICQSPNKLGEVTPGSPRSPDGKWMIIASGLGPIVFGGKKPELWSNVALNDRTLTDCVVSNGATAIACISDGRLLLVPRQAN